MSNIISSPLFLKLYTFATTNILMSWFFVPFSCLFRLFKIMSQVANLYFKIIISTIYLCLCVYMQMESNRVVLLFCHKLKPLLSSCLTFDGYSYSHNYNSYVIPGLIHKMLQVKSSRTMELEYLFVSFVVFWSFYSIFDNIPHKVSLFPILCILLLLLSLAVRGST